jgi:putative DNA primase/helicase
MFQNDSFFLARLVNGGLDAGRGRDDLPRLSPIFQPVAARLLAALPRERQSIWDDFLAGRLRPEPISEPLPASGPPAMTALEQSSARTKLTNLPARLQPLSAAPADRAVEPERQVKLTCASNVDSREVDWLWAGRVPLGMITMFAGDPKLGKSYVTLSMAAALSRGLPLPVSDLPNRTGSTILMSAEDDPARTIVPRLTAAGADLAKVHILESVLLANGSETLPSLRADIDAITAAAVRLGDCRLIVIDPVSAYLNGIDDNRNAVLRGVLTPLSRLAEQIGAAVLLVSHLTKRKSTNGRHRVMGSIAYVGACRANHLFVPDPHDPTGRRVLMLDNGGNLAPSAATLAYVIEDRGSGPRVEWSDQTVPITVQEALQPEIPPALNDERTAERLECDDWLRMFLAEGPKSTIEVFQAGNDAGFTKDQTRRAKYRVGATAKREGFDENAQWSWELPLNAPLE